MISLRSRIKAAKGDHPKMTLSALAVLSKEDLALLDGEVAAIVKYYCW